MPGCRRIPARWLIQYSTADGQAGGERRGHDGAEQSPRGNQHQVEGDVDVSPTAKGTAPSLVRSAHQM